MRLIPALRQTTLAITLAAATGCEYAEPIGPIPVSNGIQAGTLSVAAGSDGLTLNNQTERPVFFIAFESELATLIDWIPCTGGTGCSPLVQGERRVVAWSAVPGYAPSKPSYLLYWWNTDVEADGRVRVTNLQSMRFSR